MSAGRVLVTGASSGIGKATALALDRAGMTVFAAVRTPDDAEAASAGASERLRPVMLDVTDASSIAAASEQVGGLVGEAGLTGLVNNAGIAAVGPLEYLPLARLRTVLEVNVIGVVAVTQAFLPLLRRGVGRIVNVSSVGAWISLPYVSPINASKAAVEKLNDALRMELEPFGLRVIAVEPGSIRTPGSEGLEAMAERAIASLPDEGRDRYGAALDRFVRAMSRQELQGSPPEAVAAAVLTALTAREPRTRYSAGARARTLSWLGRLLPNPALDALRRSLFR